MRAHLLSLLSFSLLAFTACNLTATEPGTGKGDSRESAAPAAASPNADTGTPASDAAAAAPPASRDGAVFTLSNDATANEVIIIHRDEDGALSAAGKIATGGKGTGKGLGSQGALALSEDGRFLVVVDPGSNEITSFAVNGTSLELRSRVSSEGVMPVSVTIHGNLVYALNGGDASCIAGFRMDEKGMLSSIPDTVRSLSAPKVGPAQVSFSPKGDALVVTEKGSNLVDTFVVRADGTPSYGAAETSAGMTPFGFAFTPHGELIVSEAFGGAAGAGALSSYQLSALRSDDAGGSERDIAALSASVPDLQSAPCWVAVTTDGRWAFTTNTASGNISAYSIEATGTIALVGDGVAASTGTGTKPIDMTFDRTSEHLLVLNGGSHTIVSFTLGAGGALTPGKAAAWVPDTAVGLAGM